MPTSPVRASQTCPPIGCGIGCGLASSILGILVAAGEFDMTVDDYSDRDVRRLRIDFKGMWAWCQAAVTTAVRRKPNPSGLLRVDPTVAANGPSGAANASIPLPPFSRCPRPASSTLPARDDRWYIRRYPVKPKASVQVKGVTASMPIADQDVGWSQRIPILEGGRAVASHCPQHAGRRSSVPLERLPFPAAGVTRPQFFHVSNARNGGKVTQQVPTTCDRCDKPDHGTSDCPTYPPRNANDNPDHTKVRATEADDVNDLM